MFLQQFFVRGLGHASYLVGDEDAGVAAVVDPRRDVDEYLRLAEAEGLRIVEVLETHVHNDYVSGADELRMRTGATVRAGADAALTRPHQAVRDGDTFDVGSLRFRVLGTPGHTPDHVSFAVADRSRSDDDWVLFSGGALLVGTAARPDLLGGPEEAARAAAVEFASLRDRIAPLPDWVELYPTHGSGSLCGSGIGGKRWSTIGYERRHNRALRQPDADAFRRYILANQPTVPAYWRRMRGLNQAGATPIAELDEPRPLGVDEVEHALGHDAVAVDARPAEAFAAGHVPGSFGIGLGDTFGTWVGSVVPADRKIVLVLADEGDLDDALAQLRRAGYDDVLGYLDGSFGAWERSGNAVARLEMRAPDDVADGIRAGDIRVLDVREANEWRDGHIEGAIHIPGGELPRRLDEVPADRPLAVVCAGGYRSTVAASVLQRAGRDELINIAGGVTAFAAAGHPLVLDDPQPLGAAGQPARPSA